MGYGGTGYATVSVDIVQADVNAIVQGITGTYGRTLSDLETDLGAYLNYNGTSAAAYLQYIYSQMGGVLGNLSTIQGYLVGSYTGVFYDGDNTAVQYLHQISNYLNGWTNGALYDGNNSAVQYLNWISQNTSNLAYNLYCNGNSAAQYLSWISNNTGGIQNYLWDYNSYQSAASLLANILNCLQRFTFDENGRLRTTTA
jgi:hypothetical protein